MSRESQTAQPGASDRPELPGKLPDHLRAELIAFRRDLHMHPELGQPGVPHHRGDQGPAGAGRPAAHAC